MGEREREEEKGMESGDDCVVVGGGVRWGRGVDGMMPSAAGVDVK